MTQGHEQFDLPRTVFVDFAKLEAEMTGRGAGSARQHACDRPARPRRIIQRTDRATRDVRANVQDAARAVTAWVALVVDHQRDTDLDEILSQCLRPGPDPTQVNYTALTEQIEQTLGVKLSVKRVQTAIRHLRQAAEPTPGVAREPDTMNGIDALRQRLNANYQALVGSDADEATESLRRTIGTSVLSAVRAAAGRVIECDFGEGIPRSIDVDELENRFLDFIRDMVREGVLSVGEDDSPEADLKRLLVSLTDYDGTMTADMRIVVDGSRVTASLMGPDSLPGLIGQLNVLVAGRYLIDSEIYLAEMHRIAEAAAGLSDDAETRSYLNWARRQPEDERVPSPVRIASYARNNLATHLLERLYTGEIKDSPSQRRRAANAITAMKERDSGFRLIAVTEAIHHCVIDHLEGEGDRTERYFQAMGEEKSLNVLEDLYRFENNAELANAVAERAYAAFPELRERLIHT